MIAFQVLLCWRLAKYTKPRSTRRKLLIAAFVLMNLPWPYAAWLVSNAQLSAPLVAAWIIRPFFAWQFGGFLVTAVWLIADAVRLFWRMVFRLFSKEPPPPKPKIYPSRRHFIVKGAFTMAASAGVYGLAKTTAPPSVTKISIPIPGLARELAGLRVLQLSDIHLGFWVAEEEVGQVIEISRMLDPDIALVTGDLVDHNPDYAKTLANLMHGMKPRLGWYSTIGNHDIYAGADRITEIMRQNGLPMLRNQHVDLMPQGLPLVIVGTDDPGTSWATSGGPIHLNRAQHGAPKERLKILMAHRPTAWDQVLGRNIALTLVGHTHGGQLSLPFGGPGLAHLTYKRPRGHYVQGDQHLYVSRGIGSVGLPFRLNSPPEITIFELVGS